MSKEYIIRNIELIDEQIKQNEEFVKEHPNADVMILHKLSGMLMDSRKAWTDMLLRDYGVYYL